MRLESPPPSKNHAARLHRRGRYVSWYVSAMVRRKVDKARVFMIGRSQAVRIPFEYRFPTTEVYIRRDPRTGDVILSQSPGNWD